MASRFWVLGTANWTTANTASWSATSGGTGGASVPGAGDDAFFDANSGGGTVTYITNNQSVHSLDFTGFTGTFASSGTRTLTIGGVTTLTTAAVFTLGSGMTFTGGGTLTITLDNRSGGMTVTTNGKTMSGVTTMNTDANVAASATTTFADTANLSGTNILMRRGGLTIASTKTLTTTGSVSYTGSSAHTFTYSGATLSCSSWSVGAGITITGNGTSAITVTGASVTNSFSNRTYPGTTTMSGGGTCILGSANATFTNLTYTNTAVLTDNYTLESSTITGTFTATGNSPTNRLQILSAALGSTATITVTGASFSLTDVDFADISMSGATATGTRIGNLGGNSGITTSTPKTVYYVATATIGTFSDGKWATSSGGTTNVNNFPLAQDTATVDNNSFFSGGNLQLDFNHPTTSGVDSSAATAHNLTFRLLLTPAVQAYGNMAFSAQTTVAAGIGGSMSTVFRGTQTWTSNGASYTSSGGASYLTVKNLSGTLQIQDNVTLPANSTAGITLTNGTLNPLGNLTAAFLRDSGSATKAFTGTSGKTLTISVNTTGPITLNQSGTTVTPNSMNLTINPASGGSAEVVTPGSGVTWGTFSKLTTNGTTTFANSNTWAGMTATGVASNPHVFTFTAGTTQTLQAATFFAGTGPTRMITCNSTVGASAWTLSCVSTVSTDYISLQDSTASGATPFYAGANSTNVSGNTNWNFTAPPVAAKGGTMMLLGVG